MALYIGRHAARATRTSTTRSCAYGFEDAAARSKTYIRRQKAEAAAALPAELIDWLSLVGPARSRARAQRAFKDAGVGTLGVSPMAGRATSGCAQLRIVASSRRKYRAAEAHGAVPEARCGGRSATRARRSRSRMGRGLRDRGMLAWSRPGTLGWQEDVGGREGMRFAKAPAKYTCSRRSSGPLKPYSGLCAGERRASTRAASSSVKQPDLGSSGHPNAGSELEASSRACRARP